jgi:hypothetical protein
MEDMILEAIEDAGAQGASLIQIVNYVGCAAMNLGDDYEAVAMSAIDTMVKNRIILSRRGRFFITNND